MNYYILLGISDQASPEEIKSAYRSKAKDLHPDHYGQDCKPFQELQEAYSILSDPKRKAIYDRELSRKKSVQKIEPITFGISSVRRARSPVEPLDTQTGFREDISLRNSYDTYFPDFNEIFERIWRNFTAVGVPKSEHAQELRLDVPISYADAQRGGRIQVLIPAEYNCPVCQGRTYIGDFTCIRCSGVGHIRGEIPLIVRIPSGMQQDFDLHYSLEQYGIRNVFLTLRICISK